MMDTPSTRDLFDPALSDALRACRDCGAPRAIGKSRCWPCLWRRTKPYYQKYRAEHLDKITAKTKRNRTIQDNNFPLMHAFHGARSRAKATGVPFTIEYTDLLPLPKLCPVFGIPLLYNAKARRKQPASASIDRIVPSLGYVPGNVAVISSLANWIKGQASVDELERVVAYIKKFAPLEPINRGPIVWKIQSLNQIVQVSL